MSHTCASKIFQILVPQHETQFRALPRPLPREQRLGRTTVHDWPILSIRASGGQKLADEGNEVQSITLDAMIEFDFAAYGQERGLAREID